MPLLIAALWGALVPMLGSMVARVLISLGIGYLAFAGIDAGISWVRGEFLSGLNGIPQSAVGLAGLLKVDVCVSMLLSAVVMRVTYAGLTSGVVKRMVIK